MYTDAIRILMDPSGWYPSCKAIAKVLGWQANQVLGDLTSKYNYYAKENMLVDDKWFYATYDSINENICIGKFYIKQGQEVLVEKGILEVKLMGMPRKTYYSINFEKVTEVIEKYIKTEKTKKENKKSKITTKKTELKQNAITVKEKEEITNTYDKYLNKVNIDNIKSELKETEKDVLEDILKTIKDILDSNKSYIIMQGDKKELSEVKQKIFELNEDDLVYVAKQIKNTTKEIKNIKAYITSCLWNCKMTINTYYQNQVNKDLYNENIVKRRKNSDYYEKMFQEDFK